MWESNVTSWVPINKQQSTKVTRLIYSEFIVVFCENMAYIDHTVIPGLEGRPNKFIDITMGDSKSELSLLQHVSQVP